MVVQTLLWWKLFEFLEIIWHCLSSKHTSTFISRAFNWQKKWSTFLLSEQLKMSGWKEREVSCHQLMRLRNLESQTLSFPDKSDCIACTMYCTKKSVLTSRDLVTGCVAIRDVGTQGLVGQFALSQILSYQKQKRKPDRMWFFYDCPPPKLLTFRHSLVAMALCVQYPITPPAAPGDLDSGGWTLTVL